jgi:hypothetical protein
VQKIRGVATLEFLELLSLKVKELVGKRKLTMDHGSRKGTEKYTHALVAA